MDLKPSRTFVRRSPSLYSALQAYNVAKVKDILKRYGSAEVQAAKEIMDLMRKAYQIHCKNSMSPLEAAIYVGNFNIVKTLIEEGAFLIPSNKARNLLRHALERGHSKVATLLLNAGASVLSEIEYKMPLYFALMSKHCVEDTVKAIVNAGFPPNQIIDKSTNQTAIHVAVKLNQISIVEYLLSELKVDPNVRDIAGLTPLHYATQNQHSTIIEMLVIYGAKIDAECDGNFTPLFYAISSGKTSTVKQLLSLGSNIHHISGQTISFTPLHFATTLCQLKIVKLLLEREADVNKSTQETNELAIHSAARINCPDVQKKISLDCIIELFIKEKSNLSSRDRFGWTPLQIAIRANNLNFAKALISNGSQLNEELEGSVGVKIPFHTVSATCEKELIKLCLEYGADCHKRNDEGYYPAQTAMVAALKESAALAESFLLAERDLELHPAKPGPSKDYSDVFKIFIKHGFPVELLTRMRWIGGQRPLYPKEVNELMAQQLMLTSGVRNNQVRYVKKAIKQGAEVKYCSTEMFFPVHFLALKGSALVLKSLLSRGARVNVLNADGKTPLHIAAEHGHYECCFALLENGAMYNPKNDKCPQTPLELAKEKNHTDVVNLLTVIKRQFNLMRMGAFDESTPISPILTCCNRQGNTLLALAIEHNHEVAATIIKLRAFVTSNLE